MKTPENPAHNAAKCAQFQANYMAVATFPCDQVEKARLMRNVLVQFKPEFAATFKSLGYPL